MVSIKVLIKIQSNEKLTKLVNLFSEKYSTSIVTTSKKSDWKLKFPVPLILKPEFEYHIGMMYFNVYNTVYNNYKHNNTFSIGDKGDKIIQLYMLFQQEQEN